jgi:hypothetical protein
MNTRIVSRPPRLRSPLLVISGIAGARIVPGATPQREALPGT